MTVRIIWKNAMKEAKMLKDILDCKSFSEKNTEQFSTRSIFFVAFLLILIN